MSDEQLYRPSSPDLSNSASNPNRFPPRLERLPSYQIQEPTLPQGYSFSPRGSYDASPFFSPSTQQPPLSYFGARTGSQSNALQYQSPVQSAPPSLIRHQSQPNSVLSPSYTQSPARIPFQQPYPSYESSSQGSRIPQQAQLAHLNQPFSAPDDMARLRQRKAVNYNEDHNGTTYDEPATYQHPPISQASYHVSMPQQQMQISTQPFPPEPSVASQQQTEVPAQVSLAPTSMDIDVRTKFPVARIKRIMQADEDVGKVAQATPTAVSKALELFMIALVAKGASEAKIQNSKRVTATHLKTALMSDSQFDFLGEICQAVPDEGGKKVKSKSEPRSEHEDMDSDDSGPAKKKRKSKKSKKGGSDAESD